MLKTANDLNPNDKLIDLAKINSPAVQIAGEFYS